MYNDDSRRDFAANSRLLGIAAIAAFIGAMSTVTVSALMEF